MKKKKVLSSESLRIQVVQSKVISDTLYSTVRINWETKCGERFDLNHASIEVFDVDTGADIKKKVGWFAMVNSRPAILEDPVKSQVRSVKERYVYIMSKTKGRVYFKVESSEFTYDGKDCNEFLNFDYEEENISANNVVSVPYVIKEVNFLWDYKSIYANEKHQLKFQLEVIATSSFDSTTGYPNPCDESFPEINGMTLPLSDDPTLGDFVFKSVTNGVEGDLIHFDPDYQVPNEYLHQGVNVSVSKESKEEPLRIVYSDLSPCETRQIYTFYIVAYTPTEIPENICVIIPKGPRHLAFPYTTGCSANVSDNQILAITPTKYDVLIDSQIEGTYTLTSKYRNIEEYACDKNKSNCEGRYWGLNIEEKNNFTNTAKEIYYSLENHWEGFDKSFPVYCQRDSHHGYPSDYSGIDFFLHVSKENIETKGNDLTNYFINIGTFGGFITVSRDIQYYWYAFTEFHYANNEEVHSCSALKLYEKDLDDFFNVDNHLIVLIAHRNNFDHNDKPVEYANPDMYDKYYSDVNNNKASYHIIDSYGNTSNDNLTYKYNGQVLADNPDDPDAGGKILFFGNVVG